MACVHKSLIEHVLPKSEPQKHQMMRFVDKNVVECVLPTREPQKHQMMRCVDRNVVECVLPTREPQRHKRKPCIDKSLIEHVLPKRRASETRDQALCRQDRARNAKKRALESSEDYSQRKQSNKTAMTIRRSKALSVGCAISAFHAEVKLGPDFVCTCCHRMMYRKSVTLCNKANYTKASADVIQKVFSADLSISSDGNEWVCRTCDRTLKRGNMPLQAKANGFSMRLNHPDLVHKHPSHLASPVKRRFDTVEPPRTHVEEIVQLQTS